MCLWWYVRLMTPFRREVMTEQFPLTPALSPRRGRLTAISPSRYRLLVKTERAETSTRNGNLPLPKPEQRASVPRPLSATTGMLLLMALLWTPYSLRSAAPEANPPRPSRPFGGPLSLADAVNLALHQSPAILRAQKQLEANQGISVQTRAIALPT